MSDNKAFFWDKSIDGYVIRDKINNVIYKGFSEVEVSRKTKYLNKNINDYSAILSGLEVMEASGKLTKHGYLMLDKIKIKKEERKKIKPSELIHFGNEVIGGNTYNPDDFKIKESLKKRKISDW